MVVKGVWPKAYSSPAGTFVFCPICHRAAEVLSEDPAIYLSTRRVGTCPRCRRAIPECASGAATQCVACFEDRSSMSLAAVS
jgi:hypothetical protein